MNKIKSAYFVVIIFAASLLQSLKLMFHNFGHRLFFRTKLPEFKCHEYAIGWGQRIMEWTPGWSVNISGRQHLPASNTPVVLVANHESAADIFSIYLLRIQFRWLSKVEVFRIPFIGTCMKLCGYIAIKRGDKNSHKFALDECSRLLQEKVPVLFFPEGTRSTDGKPKKFKAGAFSLAIKNDVPVLPVVLSGAGKLLQKGTLSPRKAEVTIKVLPQTKALPDETAQTFAERIEQLIRIEHEKITQIS